MVTIEAYRELEEQNRELWGFVKNLEIALAAATEGKPHEVEEEVISAIRERREKGRRKYETSMERTDLSTLDWVQHAQEEAMDLAIYLQRIKRQLSTP